MIFDKYWIIGILASQGLAFLLGRRMGADLAIKEFEGRGDLLSAEPHDLVWALWGLVNETSMFAVRRRRYHRLLDILRQKLPLENPERAH